MEIPSHSMPYLSEVTFCQSEADFARIHIPPSAGSRILTCDKCNLVVHSRCYGCEDALEADIKGPSKWLCDPCAADVADPVSHGGGAHCFLGV